MKQYGAKEEKINVVSHAIGIVLASVGLILLLIKGFIHKNPTNIISYTIFALSMILLYTASTLYHNSKEEQKRKHLKIFDHASIYILIAGSYTPFALIGLQGTIGWLIFGVAWGIALTGIILKLFFTGRF
ncbi:MAG: hemolysin III family protein, partial [Salinivirgaceae bacterium]|nr:hemolysin III family protein [Salinivirgaceae bacterium]